ncbi:MAG: cobyrinate a,c-diamide synthase [Lachnospiraceae bacterium]
MNQPSVLIAAIKSGSGKTLFTCGFLRLLQKKGKHPTAFKCGPDFIDPMFHREVLGVPSCNLDSFLADETSVQNLFMRHASDGDVAVIEGVMGLYDGLGGVTQKASAYEVAVLTKTPILLVLDAHGMGRTMCSVLKGILQDDTEHLIRGVILNRASAMFVQMMKPLIEKETGLAVLGYLPNVPQLAVESRHLGLWLPQEISNLQKKIDQTAELLEETLDLGKVWQIVKAYEKKTFDTGEKKREAEVSPHSKVRVAVARDAAFCFYYEENLNLLQQAGADLIFFSPIEDSELPDHCDALLLGGGYPENYAKQLSRNASMKESIRMAIESGMPSLAECGGFLYLLSQLEDTKKQKYAMIGVQNGCGTYQGKLVRFGYVEIMPQAKDGAEEWLLRPGEIMRAHEFHYYDSTTNGSDAVAKKPIGTRSWSCLHLTDHSCWGFPHLYYASCPAFVERFVKKAQKYKEKKKKEARKEEP